MIIATQNDFLTKLPSTVVVQNNELLTDKACFQKRTTRYKVTLGTPVNLWLSIIRLLLFFMCHRSKQCLIFFCCSLMYFRMDACLSVIRVLIIRPHPRRYAMQFLNPRNSIAGLLPATFLYKQNNVSYKCCLGETHQMDLQMYVLLFNFVFGLNFSIIHIQVLIIFFPFVSSITSVS